MRIPPPAILRLVVPAVLLLAGVGGAHAQGALRLGPGNTDTYVAIGNVPKLGLSTFTIETWFIRQGAGVPTSTGTGGIASFLPLVTRGAGAGAGTTDDANWLLGIDTASDVLAADFQEGAGGAAPGANHPVTGTTPIVNDVWYHAAATYDGTTWRLYLNGVLEAELVVGQPARADGVLPAALGTALAADATPHGYFDGTLDEVRVWDVARTSSQIRATLNAEVPSVPTLVARWALDDGAGTTAIDAVAPEQDGSITNASFAWVASAPFDVVPCDDGTSACDDGLFCNGTDSCDAALLRCTIHAGDPCAGGTECSDTCNEAANDCLVPAGTACTDDGNVCTDDACDGAGSCVATANTASCDDGAFCNGTDTCSGGACVHAGDPCAGGAECADTCNESADDCLVPTGTACPDDGNVCTSDVCDGAGACTHPAGNAGTTCRAAAGACDLAESCDGSSASCPADEIATAGTTCRPVAGGCDVAESCTGASVICPADEFVDAGTECRASAGQCDVPEACTGAAAACPANGFVPDGTACDDGEICSADDACDAGACVATLDPAVCLDHFTCYAATQTPGTPRFRAIYALPLTDAFGSTTADVRKSRMLCAPASVNGEDPAAVASPEHLEEYLTKVSPRFEKTEGRRIVNRFGTLVVDVVKSTGVAVPTAKSLVAIPPPLAAPATDEFQCYRVRPAKGSPRFAPVTGLALEDGLGSFTVDLRKLKRLCAPVDRFGNDPDAPTHRAYLACYQVKQTSAPKFAKVTPIYASNPFGGETLDLKSRAELCVPSLLDP